MIDGAGFDPAPPRATYRLQLHRDFGFSRAQAVLPYLAALGISHVYCSPYLQATPGSLHGYDVVDPQSINPELGSATEFQAFCHEVRELGLQQMLDIVPNHMGIGCADNRWWDDVLRAGSASAFADCFDIDWDAGDGRVILPILGDEPQAVIARGELVPRFDAERDEWRLSYFERSLPLADGSVRHLGKRDGPIAAADIAALLDDQHYRLVHWRQAARGINYRRFFDIDTLAGVRVEDPAVFERSHSRILSLVADGTVAALRIDHPDGLRDPAGYFSRLQQRIAETRGIAGRMAERLADDRPLPFYVAIEKIVAPGENMPAQWAVAGTTGYDFANQIGGVTIDGDQLLALDEEWRGFTGETAPSFAQVAYEAKREILLASFGGELDRLVQLACYALIATSAAPSAEGIEADAIAADTLRDALVEVIAEFPVYRSYIVANSGEPPSSADRDHVETACRRASDRIDQASGPATGPTGAAIAAIGRLLLDGRAADFIARFQQLTAPVTAKGIEDTAIYRWTRLMSVNGVGGDPDVVGMSVDRFHLACQQRAADWPHAMLATSTHDNKRSEDVRMRINVISEMPREWGAIARRWRERVHAACASRGQAIVPDDSDLYLLLQTIVGSWPTDPGAEQPDGDGLQPPALDRAARDAYAQRLKDYMRKACRETRRRTSWTDPDEAYEQAFAEVVDDLLGAQGPDDLLPVCRRFHWHGGLDSLTLVVLKTTLPGVPDIYQGADLVDGSLVDPDNRRPVDFVLRERMLASMIELSKDSVAPGPVAGALRDCFDRADFDRLKLWTLHRILDARRRVPTLFSEGEHTPIAVRGPKARHLIVHARRLRDATRESTLLVIAPRLTLVLGASDRATLQADDLWADTVIDLPAASIRAGRYRDLLTGVYVEIAEGLLPAQSVFSGHACAVLLDEASWSTR